MHAYSCRHVQQVQRSMVAFVVSVLLRGYEAIRNHWIDRYCNSSSTCVGHAHACPMHLCTACNT